MRSGLNGFVQNRQEQKYKVTTSTSETGRRNIGPGYKFEPTSSFKTPSQQTYPSNGIAAPNTALTQTNLSKVQPSGADASSYHQYGDLFDGSILSNDSDDTLRDGTIGIKSQEQSSQYDKNQQISRHAPFPDQDDIKRSQSMNAEGPEGSDGEEDVYEGGSDHENNGRLVQQGGLAHTSRMNRFGAPVRNPAMSNLTEDQAQKWMQAAKQSENYKQAKKEYGDSPVSRQVAHMFHGRSGRFAGTDIPLGARLVVERSSHTGRNRDRSPEDIEYSDSDLPQTPTRPGEADATYSGRSNDLIVRHEIDGHVPNIVHHEDDTSSHRELASSSGQSTPHKHDSRVQGLVGNRVSHVSKHANNKRAADELDYEADELSKMTYAELKGQPFDNDPNRVPWDIPQELGGPEISLERRLEYFGGRTEHEQTIFFQQMPIEEWEECGDWFLDRFGDIMSRLKEARRVKRQVSKAFEEELASREEIIRAKTEGVQEVMRQMRAGGEGVLRGRTP